VNKARRLYQLQEIDLDIEANQMSLEQLSSQLGGSEVVQKVRLSLESEKERLADHNQQQRSLEWEIDDLSTKIGVAEQRLYSGKIQNPKELANLQHEIDGWKKGRDQLEDQVLDIMETVDSITSSINSVASQLSNKEEEWQNQQQKLTQMINQIEAQIADLNLKRQRIIDHIDSQAVELYLLLKNRMAAPIAKVEQGVCGSCRISLPTTDLQRVKGSRLIQCGSCNAILFQP
jgi:LSD1 subclass zinc finger protein